MFLLQEVWRAALAAALSALVLLALLRWRGAGELTRRCSSLALALAWIAGSIVLEGWPKFPPVEKVGWLAPLAVLAALIGFTGPRARRWSAPALVLAGAGVTAAVALSGSLRLAELAFLAALLAGASWLAVESAPLVPAVLLLALVGLGFRFADLPGPCAILLAAAVASSFVPLGAERQTWKTIALRLAAALVPGAIAVALAFHASPPLEY